MRLKRSSAGVDLIERMLRLGALAASGETVTYRRIMDKFQVSRATATRDMQRLEAALAVEAEQQYTNLPRKLRTR